MIRRDHQRACGAATNLRLRFLIAGLVLASSARPSGAAEPSRSLDRPWLVNSLLPGSRLANRNLFDIAFERGSSGIKSIWVASSDGLHSYDGYQWRRYGKADGLPSNFVRSVLVTRSGKLWVGTSEGAGMFDGKSFSTYGSESGLAGPNVRRIVEDVDGTLWFCSDSWPSITGSGGLASYNNGQWRRWHHRDGLPSDYVVNFFRNSQGQQFVVTSHGVAQLQGNRWVAPFSGLARAGLNWGSASIAESPRFGMIVSTGADLFVQKNGKWRAIPDTLRHEHGIIATSDGAILACGDAGPRLKAFVEWDGDHWKPVSAPFSVPHDYVENLREAADGSVYAVGFDSLTRWERTESAWQAFSGTPKPLFSDPAGTVWSMDERGFFAYRANHWEDLGAPYKQLIQDATGVWAWNAQTLVHWMKTDASVRTKFDTAIARYETVTLDRQGKLWVSGRDIENKNRLLRFDGNAWSEIAVPNASWMVASPDPVAGMWYLVHYQAGKSALLKVRDNYKAYPVPSELVAQYINFIHADRQGNMWLLGDTGLHRWREERPASWDTIPGLPGRGVTSCLEVAGEIWFVVDGTLGGKSGLASFSHGAWKTFDADPISSSAVGRSGQLLLGSKGKFYIVPAQGDRTPIVVRLPEPDQVIGILEDNTHTYWLGTPQGTFWFCPSASPPQTAWVSYDQQVIEGNKYRGRARGRERFHPSEPAANFVFSWSFDNGPWSAFDARAERTFNTAGLTLGAHDVKVRARNNSMVVDPVPAVITFRIHQLPLQERRWFIPALVCIALLLGGLTVVAGVARLKLARQAAQLEQMVEARTAELLAREEQLRRSNLALQRTNQDLRQFSWAASHDLQEPLRMVVTYTQFLAKRYQDKLDDTGRQFISYAVDGAHRVQTLLQALLEYWQVSEGNQDASTGANVSVAAALNKALGNLELLLRESGAVIFPSELPHLDVSETALVQLFQNLISNAVKYRSPDRPPRVEVFAQPLGAAGWQFSVKDNGIGIASEHQALVFQLFKRLNGNLHPGTGIGLALCAKIVENFGGRMWVESELGRGSSFYFTVPGVRQ